MVLDPKPEALKRIYPGMQALVLIPEVTDAAIMGDVRAIDGKEAMVGNSAVPCRPSAPE